MTRTLGSVRGAAGNGGPYRDRGSGSIPGSSSYRPAGRRVVLRAAWADPRPAVCSRWDPWPVAERGPSAGVRRRLAPHRLRHAHAVEMSCEGIPLLVIPRQRGHADLRIPSAYLRGIDNTEIIHAVNERLALAAPGADACPKAARQGHDRPRRLLRDGLFQLRWRRIASRRRRLPAGQSWSVS